MLLDNFYYVYFFHSKEVTKLSRHVYSKAKIVWKHVQVFGVLYIDMV